MDRRLKIVAAAKPKRIASLKRLALLWAQAHGYTACAAEVSLPRCRYRADVAAYRSVGQPTGPRIFECKQALGRICAATIAARARQREQRLGTLSAPAARSSKNIFAFITPPCASAIRFSRNFDSHDFEAIGHHGYRRGSASSTRCVQHRLYGCTKFESLMRYRCANLFFLVLANELFRECRGPARLGRAR